jgi:S1-C subfamily serine protease
MKQSFGALLAAAVLGGGVTAGVLLGAGVVDDGQTRTVVQQAPLDMAPRASSAPASDDGGKALTAAEIYKRDAPGVVFISATIVQQTQSPFELFPRAQENRSTGSGFVIDDEGYIVTNAHVVASASDVKVQFADDKIVKASVAGTDPSTDLALLKVDTDGVDLKPLEFGDSSDVQVGDPTIAIGNPFGLDRTLTTGVVSALQRRISAPNDFTIENVIQTDAAINPGNSGGPLLDATGRVIGVNSQIATAEGARGNIGIGFAVPINTVKQVVPQLKEDGRVSRPYLGVSFRAVTAPEAGLLVDVAAAGGPADRAGIGGGDIIVSLNGKPTRSAEDMARFLGDAEVGDLVQAEVRRGDEKTSVQMRLEERPEQSPFG